MSAQADHVDQKRSKIDELIKYIQERLTELEGEKEELENFQVEDRERRCLEYALYSREQMSVLDQLGNVAAALLQS